jgi:two-component system, LytTR family, response regulator
MTIRVVIADDEPPSRRALQQLLARHADVAVTAECADGESAIAAIQRDRPDVVFLDVRMPLASGLDVARQRDRRAGPVVVFVTAFEEFAVPAFDVGAADYLMKPLLEGRFDAAMERVRERLAGRRVHAAHLVARVGTRDVIIPIDDVDYVQADDVYAAVLGKGKRHLVRESLNALEGELDPRLFSRVHRSFIVRLDRVTEIRRDADGGVELVARDGAVIPVSRRRRGALRALLKPSAT